MKQNWRCAPIAGLLILPLFLLGLLVAKPNIPVQATVEDPLYHAVRATGASVQELTVNGWAILPVHELADDEMTVIVRQAMEKLGYRQNQYQVAHLRNARHRQVKAEALDKRSHTVVLVQVLYPVWEKKGHEVYMVVNVEKNAPDENAAILKETVARIIKDYGGLARVNTCLLGWLDGKLEEEERVSKLNAAFQAVDASIIHSLRYPNLASYTGFTPLVNESLLVGEDQVNINMAIRYSQYDNRSYIMVGSPVITKEY